MEELDETRTCSVRREGGREGGREGEREGGRERGREGGREGGRGRGRERGREGGREGGRERGREPLHWNDRERKLWIIVLFICSILLYAARTSLSVSIVEMASEFDWNKKTCVSVGGV